MKPDELAQRGFGLYEQFRPKIPEGVSGWGAKGELDLGGIAKGLKDAGYFVEYDDSGTIGKRYRRNDEAGTPFCVTVDFDSIEDRKVTVRERDPMTQERIPIAGLVSYLRERL